MLNLIQHPWRHSEWQRRPPTWTLWSSHTVPVCVTMPKGQGIQFTDVVLYREAR